ncbi:MAG: DUF6338 family protein [Actinobacteria bacterium]|nr:DUF6338 family protein [Actinomycetota bacterium]
MPETFQALGVLIVALLPGALYIWSLERLAGLWGIKLSDRLLRFVGVSAVFHALAAPATLWFWREYVHAERLFVGPIPWAVWPLAIAYVAVPIIGGTIVGWGTRHRRRWARIFTGPEPAPRAWDHLFATRPDGWIRLKMKSGAWLGGAYAQEGELPSYAAGYPEPQDLFLVDAFDVDAETGEFLMDRQGRPVPKGSSILVSWDEVEYLDFTEG